MPGADPDPDPKLAGMGGDGGSSSVDLMLDTHKTVRELLLALEALSPPAGGVTDAFDSIRSKAQIARRRLEDIDSDLTTARAPVVVSSNATTSGGTGLVLPAIHVHVHITLPQLNGGRSKS
jgi:hypothetical protein